VQDGGDNYYNSQLAEYQLSQVENYNHTQKLFAVIHPSLLSFISISSHKPSLHQTSYLPKTLTILIDY